MTNRTAAIRYARALFDVALAEKANLDELEQQLTAFGELFTQYPTLAHVLLNPVVPATRKRAAIVDLAARAQVAPMLAKLLILLAERDRLALLLDLVVAYRERLMDHRQVVRAEVTTAAPLDVERTQAIERSLAHVAGRTVTLTTRVDPSIIGGVIARVGSTVYDGSVTRQLEKMRQRLESV